MIKKINPQNWYQFRKRASKVHPFILDLIYYYSSTPQMTKIYGAPPIEQINILRGDWASASVRFRHLNNFGRAILKKISKNFRFTSYLISKTKKYAKKMVRDLKILEGKKLSKFSDKKIFKIYSLLVEDYRLFCFFSFPIWLWGEKAIFREVKKILQQRKINRREYNKILNILITPSKPSFILQEEIEILKLAQKIKNIPFSKIKIKIRNLVNKFGFMIYDYRGPKVKKEKDYLREIKKISKKVNLKEEIKEKNNFYKKLKIDQKNLMKNLKLTQKEKSIIFALQDAAILQDIRKYYNSYFNFKTEILIKEMAKRLKIHFQLVRYILPHEMKEIWQEKKVDKKILKILKARTKLCVFDIKNGKSKIYLGKEMNPYLVLEEKSSQVEKVIKGVVASAGKISGRVKVIKTKEEIKNIKRGEILVTPMTTPDFAPALKKCIAIVTDEGGITCHAAIVSRELGIPCIIGTKIATKVLKDGDFVEVDANKGMVRVIKRGRKNKTKNF